MRKGTQIFSRHKEAVGDFFAMEIAGLSEGYILETGISFLRGKKKQAKYQRGWDHTQGNWGGCVCERERERDFLDNKDKVCLFSVSSRVT